MHQELTKQRRVLEIMLIVICLGLTCLLYAMQGYKMVILNLFFLPVVLGGFFLGRYRAGVMALFCVLAASTVTAIQLVDMSVAVPPLVIALAVAVWGAVLGLTALLLGTLSDERQTKLEELHEAYVGVVEVLSQYLQSAHPDLKARSIRVAELSQRVAAAMRLPPHQIDDIRVAALLYDVGDIEVTTRVLRRAVDTFRGDASKAASHTFQGMDLMLSLGPVLRGAVPLLLSQNQGVPELTDTDEGQTPGDLAVGARIIRAVRAYVELAQGALGEAKPPPAEVLEALRRDTTGRSDSAVLEALESTIGEDERAPVTASRDAPPEPVNQPAKAEAP